MCLMDSLIRGWRAYFELETEKKGPQCVSMKDISILFRNVLNLSGGLINLLGRKMPNLGVRYAQ